MARRARKAAVVRVARWVRRAGRGATSTRPSRRVFAYLYVHPHVYTYVHTCFVTVVSAGHIIGMVTDAITGLSIGGAKVFISKGGRGIARRKTEDLTGR